MVAAVDGDQSQAINPASSTSGATSLLDNMEAEGGAVGQETERRAVEPPKRRRQAKARDTYVFATLDSDFDFEKKDENKDERERKRERKQKYWDDIDQ